jgi:hypothetical protein
LGNLVVDPEQGADLYALDATSGRGQCENKRRDPCLSTESQGAIPPGRYRLYTDIINNPGPIIDTLRNNLPPRLGGADWGDWRAPLIPAPGTNLLGRSGGFFLHRGRFSGSAGCMDVGGGVYGSGSTDQLLHDILSDPDGLVDLFVQ